MVCCNKCYLKFVTDKYGKLYAIVKLGFTSWCFQAQIILVIKYLEHCHSQNNVYYLNSHTTYTSIDLGIVRIQFLSCIYLATKYQ